MDRRVVLVALARCGALTPDRSVAVRTAPEGEIGQLVRAWGISDPGVLEATGNAVVPPGEMAGPSMRKRDAERVVVRHLRELGFEEVDIVWTGHAEGNGMSVHPGWFAAMPKAVPPLWAIESLPSRVAMVVAAAESPIWAPLAGLVSHNILPYGLDSEGRFVLVNGKKL